MNGRPFKVNDGGNGANKSFYKRAQARKALNGERERAEKFYADRAKLIERMREAQAIARRMSR